MLLHALAAVWPFLLIPAAVLALALCPEKASTDEDHDPGEQEPDDDVRLLAA